MHNLIPISSINDFIFCPVSLYLHSLYAKFDKKIYHQESQITGQLVHQNIESGSYSTSKRFLQGLPVSSSRYCLIGKIDIYDQENFDLIERKFKVKRIYDGYKYQLYAQYFCLKEMGYKVKRLLIHSLSDNKRYLMPLPTKSGVKRFTAIINQIKNFDIANIDFKVNINKCSRCIYRELCKYDVDTTRS